MADRDFESQLRGWSLTTVEVLYRLPDYRNIIQSFMWQEYDQAPIFPRLKNFLDYWTKNIEGPIYKVRLANCPLIGPTEMKYIGSEWRLH
jgi:uncharacterized protein Usg